MSLYKFWHEINKFDREVKLIREVGIAKCDSEFLSGEEKEKVIEDTVRETFELHDEHFVWLYKDAIKTKLLNVALSVTVGAMGIKLLKRK